MVHSILVNGIKTKYMVRVNMSGMMAVCMMVIGLTITWMDMVVTFGKMAENMKDNTKMIRNTEKASIFGLKAESTTVCGKMEDNMGVENIYLNTVLLGKVSGTTERDYSGSTMESKIKYECSFDFIYKMGKLKFYL